MINLEKIRMDKSLIQELMDTAHNMIEEGGEFGKTGVNILDFIEDYSILMDTLLEFILDGGCDKKEFPAWDEENKKVYIEPEYFIGFCPICGAMPAKNK
jgi:hypothetical protein